MRVFLLALLATVCFSASADTYVHGYVRSDGTYVTPHYRSSPDSSSFNNYSTYGNTNPYTGSRGYTQPSYGSSYRSSSSGYYNNNAPLNPTYNNGGFNSGFGNE